MRILFVISLAIYCVFARPTQEITLIDDAVYDIFDVYIIDYDNPYRIYIATPKLASKSLNKIPNKAPSGPQIPSPKILSLDEFKAQSDLSPKDSPKDGFKVLYILDANAQFPIILNLYAKKFKDYNDLIIVGIGYNSGLAYDIKLRTFDYTPEIINKKNNKMFQNGGGAGKFYDFLHMNLMPFVESNYRINNSKKSLFGHSFGGLFCLYVLFNHSDTFDNYICASPSLWWGEGSIIPQNMPYLENYPKSITITLGELELESKRGYSPINAEVLAQRLKEQSGGFGNVQFLLFEDKTHGSIIPDALESAIKAAILD